MMVSVFVIMRVTVVTGMAVPMMSVAFILRPVATFVAINLPVFVLGRAGLGLHARLGAGLVILRIVHAQQIHAVIVAIRGAHYGVNVKLGWKLVGEKHAGVVIELDHHHRALNPVIERIVFSRAADPTEMRVVEMALHFFHARL